jgi:hypothetical protein
LKRRIVITVIAAILILSTTRLLLKTQSEFEDERQSYVRSLNYDFSARVDSMIVLNKNNGRGFLVCKIIDAQLSGEIEDSLNRRLQNHAWMRFMFLDSKGRAQIFRDDVFKYNPGDSVYVNSSTDQFNIYRNGADILQSSVSEAIKQKVSWESWLKSR